MSDCGTIDESGFRADLQAIAQNDYPPLQLVKLPFNWFVPQSGGILQSVLDGITATVLVPGTRNGDAIVVFFTIINNGPASGALLTDFQLTDTAGNHYVGIVQHQTNFAGFNSYGFIAQNIAGGSVTITIASVLYPVAEVGGVIAIEVGGVTGITSVSGGNETTGVAVCGVGDLALSWAGRTEAGAYSWTQSSGWTQLAEGTYPGVGFSGFQLVAGGSTIFNTMVPTPPSGAAGNDQLLIVLRGDFVNTPAGVPPPLTSVPLPGPCNFIALVSEAIDENGQYQESALIGQQAAAGFIRLNGGGNVWIPISFAPPLIPGYVTSSDNYANNPIAGTGFSAIEAPFGVLDWQPASPVYYSGPNPPSTPDGFLLAFVGLSVGVGASTGAGSSSTHAIPSAAGPIARLKDAGLI